MISTSSRSLNSVWLTLLKTAALDTAALDLSDAGVLLFVLFSLALDLLRNFEL
jgi:hypothetical protein